MVHHRLILDNNWWNPKSRENVFTLNWVQSFFCFVLFLWCDHAIIDPFVARMVIWLAEYNPSCTTPNWNKDVHSSFCPLPHPFSSFSPYKLYKFAYYILLVIIWDTYGYIKVVQRSMARTWWQTGTMSTVGTIFALLFFDMRSICSHYSLFY